MKRISKKRESMLLRQAAIEQFKKTRSRLYYDHPDLFKALEILVFAKSNIQAQAAIKREPWIVDRKKNMRTVMRYVEMKQSSTLNQKIRAYLS